MEITQNRSEEIYKNYLEHHQIKGAEWGKMHGPPYPLSKKISTGKSLRKDVIEKDQTKPKNGIAGMLARSKAKKVEEQKQKAKAAALQKAREAKAQKANEEKAKEELKKKVMGSHSAAMLYKHADLFTTDELREMKNRLQVENEIKNLSPAEINKGQKFINTMSTAGDIFNKTSYAMDNGIKTYNNVAKVLNSFTNADLPLIKDPFKDNNNGNNGNNGNKNRPSTESYTKLDENGKIRFSKKTTDDGKGNKVIVEQTFDDNKKKK